MKTTKPLPLPLPLPRHGLYRVVLDFHPISLEGCKFSFRQIAYARRHGHFLIGMRFTHPHQLGAEFVLTRNGLVAALRNGIRDLRINDVEKLKQETLTTPHA